jgi:Right handed beta helix region
MLGRAIAIAAGAALVGAPAASAVTPVTCGPGLQTAINSAAAGEVLQLPAGICHANLSVTNANAFTLEGATGGGTTLMPSLPGPIIAAGIGTPVHFTLAGITFDGAGGGPDVFLQDPGEAATFTGNTFTNSANASSVGGAISIQTQFNPGTVATEPTVISGNTFAGNHASDGGAVALLGLNGLTVSGNKFTGNSAAAEAGALDLAAPTPTTNPIDISGNTFGGLAPADANTSTWPGGAVSITPAQGQPVTIANNTFAGNAITGVSTKAREGGGLYIFGASDTTAPVTQSHNTFTHNAINSTQSTPSPLLLSGGAGEFVLGGIVHSVGDRFIGNRVSSPDGAPPYGGALGVLASGGATLCRRRLSARTTCSWATRPGPAGGAGRSTWAARRRRAPARARRAPSR